MVEKLMKMRNYFEKNKASLQFISILTGAMSIVLILTGSVGVGGLFLLFSGLSGFGPRFLDSGVLSAIGLVLVDSSVLAGYIFGLFFQIVLLGAGVYLMLKPNGNVK